MAFDRKKSQKVALTIKKVSLDTIRDRYHFQIEESDKICQVTKDGTDEATTSFSKPFSCILDTFATSIAQFDQIDDEVCGNPSGFCNVEKAIYLVLKQLRGLKVEITRHFAKTGEIVNNFKIDTDKWITDTITIVDVDEFKKRLKDEDFKERFETALNKIEREDDF